MKKRILILEQQSWVGGAQRVLEVVLSSLINEFDPIVGFPDDGPFSMAPRPLSPFSMTAAECSKD